MTELEQILANANKLELFDHPGARKAWQTMLTNLEAVDRDLVVVATDPAFSLELCPACWDHDWNHSGQVDDRDRKLFEIEYDAKGDELPAGDPRRRPTFRFDVGDAYWARSMIAFQRAVGELVLAYKWSDLDKVFGALSELTTFTLKLTDRDRVKRARELVLAGLGFVDQCRVAYRAETDDDREWVPNPRQHNYSVPLAIDDAVYQTWEGVTGDVRKLLTSEQGVSMRELAGAADKSIATRAPDAYVDFGKLLSDPKDIVIDVHAVFAGDDSGIERVLRGVLGNGYQPAMRRSPLVGRLVRMKSELDRDDDTFARKLRYLLWLN